MTQDTQYNQDEANIISRMIHSKAIIADTALSDIWIDILHSHTDLADCIYSSRLKITDNEDVSKTVSAYNDINAAVLLISENDNDLKKKVARSVLHVCDLMVWRIQYLSDVKDRKLFVDNVKKLFNLGDIDCKMKIDLISRIMNSWKKEVPEVFYNAPLSNSKKRARLIRTRRKQQHHDSMMT
mgnify:FL=1|tara:strand:- start:541 stop:1089 length:549 start_codon:yes stop_codon:yes gene_type:complete